MTTPDGPKDYWKDVITAITGYKVPDRNELFSGLMGNDGIPLMKVEISKSKGDFTRDTQWRVENTDYVLPFYQKHGDTAKEYKARITFLGTQVDKDGGVYIPEGVREGWTFHSGKHIKESSNLDGSWDNTKLHQYAYGAGMALEALLNRREGTSGFSYSGATVLPVDQVNLATFETATQAFDRVARFFHYHGERLNRWEESLGKEDAAWLGQAAGVFRDLLHQINRTYETFSEQLRVTSGGSVQGEHINRARETLRNAGWSLWSAWNIWSGEKEANPLHILYDNLENIYQHVSINNHGAVMLESGDQTAKDFTTPSEMRPLGFFSEDAIQFGGPNYGPLNEMTTWKAIGQGAIDQWTSGLEQRLGSMAREANASIFNVWNNLGPFPKLQVRTVNLYEEYTKDKNEKNEIETKKKEDEAAKKEKEIEEENKAKEAALNAKYEKDKKEAAEKYEKEKAEAAAKEAAAKAEADRKEAAAKAEADRKEKEAQARYEAEKKEAAEKEAAARLEMVRREKEAKDEREREKLEQERKQAEQEAKQERKEAEQKAEQERREAEQERKQAEQEAKQERKEAEQRAEQERKEAEQQAEQKRREAEQERKQAEQEAKQERKEAEQRAEQERREAEQKAEQERREAEQTKRYEEAKGEQARKEGEAKAESRRREAEAKTEAERREKEAKGETARREKEARAQIDRQEAAAKEQGDRMQRELGGQLNTPHNPGDLVSDPFGDRDPTTGPGTGSTTVNDDGTVTTTYPDGTTTTVDPDGDTITTERPDGTRDTSPLGDDDLIYNPDGSVSSINDDGSLVTDYRDGTSSVVDPDDGTVTTVYPDGSTTSGHLGNTSGTGRDHWNSPYDTSYEEELHDPYSDPLAGPASLYGSGSGGENGQPSTGGPMSPGMMPGGVGVSRSGEGSSGERTRAVMNDEITTHSRRPSGGGIYDDPVSIPQPGSTTGSAMPPMMPPMGGGGPQQNGNERSDRERTSWVSEEEDIWGTDEGGAPAVIGR
ncbi:AAWKG family protein [Streptomyces sp. NPDC002870]|uniref:AAWKG family protein n=1 Tax=Streptomyces sp. NPDC002870 TaxID=3364666 RepID=UPI0036CF0C47